MIGQLELEIIDIVVEKLRNWRAIDQIYSEVP